MSHNPRNPPFLVRFSHLISFDNQWPAPIISIFFTDNLSLSPKMAPNDYSSNVFLNVLMRVKTFTFQRLSVIFEILAFVSDADVLGMPKFIRSTINKMSSANCGNDEKSNSFCPLKLWLKDLIKLH